MKTKDLIELLSSINPNDYVVLDLQDEWPEDIYNFTIDVIKVDENTNEVRLVPKAY